MASWEAFLNSPKCSLDTSQTMARRIVIAGHILRIGTEHTDMKFINSSRRLIGSRRSGAGFEGGAGDHNFRGGEGSRRNSYSKRNSSDSKIVASTQIEALQQLNTMLKIF